MARRWGQENEKTEFNTFLLITTYWFPGSAWEPSEPQALPAHQLLHT